MKCRYTLHTPRDALSRGSIVVPFIQIVYRHVVVFPIKSRVRVFTAFSDSCSFCSDMVDDSDVRSRQQPFLLDRSK